MTSIVGQNRLLNVISNYKQNNTLPKTLLLLGEKGCGKHTFAKFIAQQFELEYKEIDEQVTATDLDSYLLGTIDTLYVIDLNNFAEKQQNQFLKFIEEPTKSVYVVLLANSEAGVLNTVLNRSIKHHFEAYTDEQLKQLVNTTLPVQAYEIFKTPGKLLNLTEDSFKQVHDLAEKLVHKMHTATFANALVISTKINYKDLFDKVDLNLFLDAVEFVALDDYKTNNNKQSLDIFLTTIKFKQLASLGNLIKETLMLNYLSTVWEVVHNDISRT